MIFMSQMIQTTINKSSKRAGWCNRLVKARVQVKVGAYQLFPGSFKTAFTP